MERLTGTVKQISTCLLQPWPSAPASASCGAQHATAQLLYGCFAVRCLEEMAEGLHSRLSVPGSVREACCLRLCSLPITPALLGRPASLMRNSALAGVCRRCVACSETPAAHFGTGEPACLPSACCLRQLAAACRRHSRPLEAYCVQH